MPHNFKVDASLHFSPCPRNIRNITKDEMCQHYFSRINSGKKARKNLDHFKVDASLHFSPSPRNIRTLQKMGCANIPFRETIVARKLERIWKMYFIEVLLHYHFENGTLH